ncbi:hypothetical protein [Streptomyces sp. NPDC002324]
MTELDMAEPAFNGFVGQWTEGTTAGRRAPLLRRHNSGAPPSRTTDPCG